MKKLTIILTFIGFSSILYSSNLNNIDSLQLSNQIEEVVTLDSISKTDLYNRALRWFVDNTNNSNNILQLKDMENGELVGKFNYSYQLKHKGGTWDWVSAVDRYILTNVKLSLSIQILVKDNKYKYKITIENIEKNNVGVTYAKMKATINQIENDINSKNKEYITLLSESINRFITTKSDYNKDW